MTTGPAVPPTPTPYLFQPLVLGVRSAVGGLLMGLANLVPGISGGTMLLAVGIYPDFISAVAEVTTFRFRRRALLLLGLVVATAAVAILLLAGPVRSLVIHHRWIMYSVFIGLTLGGIPLVWRLAGKGSPALWTGAACGFGAMALMLLVDIRGGPAGPNYLLLALSGLAGAAAMILPGVSGGYLLLLLGQYEVVLGAVDQVKAGVLGDSPAGIAAALDAMHVIVPVGLGVLVGVVGVSNLLRWLLRRFRPATLGVLLGLLVGAVVGLWPFQEGYLPNVGDTVQGVVVTAEMLVVMDPVDWPLHFFSPRWSQGLGAAGLMGMGFGVTLLIDRIGRLGARSGQPAAGRG